jgi:hypothetical protein
MKKPKKEKRKSNVKVRMEGVFADHEDYEREKKRVRNELKRISCLEDVEYLNDYE